MNAFTVTDGLRLLSLECAVLWAPALIVGMALGFALGYRWKRCPYVARPKVVTDASGNTYPDVDGM